MGAVAGCFPGRWIDRVVTGSAVFGVSLPNYWLGIVLVIVFAVELWLLAGDRHGAERLDRVQHFALEQTPGSWSCRSSRCR